MFWSNNQWSQSKSRLPDTAVSHHSYQCSNSTCCLPCIFPLSYYFPAAIKVVDCNEVPGGIILKWYMHLLVSFFVRTLILLPIVLCCSLLYLIITSNSNMKIEEVIHLISLGIVRDLLMQVLTWDVRWKPDLPACHRPKKPFLQASP